MNYKKKFLSQHKNLHITFGAFIKKQNSNYYVSMIIFDTDYTFSNLNAKTYNNLEEANTYFSSLKDLIKNNDLESLSASLLKNCQ